MKTCHGCNGTGKIKVTGGTADMECAVCGGIGTLPDSYSIEIARNFPHLCPACGRDRSETALPDCPKDSHYAESCQ